MPREIVFFFIYFTLEKSIFKEKFSKIQGRWETKAKSHRVCIFPLSFLSVTNTFSLLFLQPLITLPKLDMHFHSFSIPPVSVSFLKKDYLLNPLSFLGVAQAAIPNETRKANILCLVSSILCSSFYSKMSGQIFIFSLRKCERREGWLFLLRFPKVFCLCERRHLHVGQTT